MREFCLIFLGAVIIFSIIQILTLKEQKRMNNEELKILHTNMQFDLAEIVATFETFIELTMGNYLILNRDFKEDTYINSEEEELLLREISKEVIGTISPFMVSKLGLIYNIEDEDDLADLITKAVYLKLLKYVAENNAIKNR